MNRDIDRKVQIWTFGPESPQNNLVKKIETQFCDTINHCTRHKCIYAEKLKTKQKSFGWFPLTAKEVSACVAIIFFMGMVEVLELRGYWNGDGLFRQYFARNSGMTRFRPRIYWLSTAYP